MVTATTARGHPKELRFQQDGAPLQYHVTVQQLLDDQLWKKCIQQAGPFTWPLRSDFTSSEFFLWDKGAHIENLVFVPPKWYLIGYYY